MHCSQAVQAAYPAFLEAFSAVGNVSASGTDTTPPPPPPAVLAAPSSPGGADISASQSDPRLPKAESSKLAPALGGGAGAVGVLIALALLAWVLIRRKRRSEASKRADAPKTVPDIVGSNTHAGNRQQALPPGSAASRDGAGSDKRPSLVAGSTSTSEATPAWGQGVRCKLLAMPVA